MYALLTALSLLCAPARGASYDPKLEWRTLQTEHFNITFHQGEEQLADELAGIAEEVHITLTADLQKVPRQRTQVVLVDNTDVANGFAQTLPLNTIVMFVTAPEENSGLDLYELWLQGIFTHEYAHILHLDTIGGLPLGLRMVLGRVISVNHLSPLWIIEGQATYHETRFTTGGRGRSPSADMIIRMSILEDQFPALGAMDGLMSGPPGGNTRYLFGQDFLQFIADQSSDDALTRWNHTYGSWVLPYLLPARRVFGQSFYALYDQWKASLEEQYGQVREQVLADGLTVPETLTFLDGSCEGPLYAPQGDRLVWSCTDRRSGSAIWVADGDGGDAHIELKQRAAKSFSWRPDGTAFAYSATHVVNDYNLYEDIYFHELGTKGATRLTSGKRARDPAFSPDGSVLLTVTNQVQNNDLAILRIDQSLAPLTNTTDHTQMSTPRWSPDGRFLALSAWHEGNRDIWIYTADGQPYRRVTMDMSTDRDPAFSADGRYLFFSSDRTGIPNIYAIDLENEHLWQVTNVLGGAFQPTVRADFQRIAWQHYTANGYRIVSAPLDPTTWRDRGALPLPVEHRGSLAALLPQPDAPPPRLPIGGHTAGLSTPGRTSGLVPSRATIADQPSEGARVDDVTEVELNLEERPYDFGYPVKPYKSLPTLFPPRYVVPTVYTTAYGLMGVLSTSGSDTLRRYLWSAYVNYRTDANFVGGGASFTVNRWKPIFTAGYSATTVPYSDVYVLPEGEPGANLPTPYSTLERYWDERHRVFASASYSRRERTYLFAYYSGQLRQPQNELPELAYRDNLPTRGFLSTVGGGWRFSHGQSYNYSISPEAALAVSVGAEWTSPYLGSYTLDDNDAHVPFNQFKILGEARRYLTNPLLPNHVLALRLAGGFSLGDNIQFGQFRLGGSYGESPFYQLPEEWRPLRGFAVGSASGDTYYLASAEYRFPLHRVNWGPGALPLFVRTLHGAVFVDAGDAFFDLSEFGPPLVGVGGELRLGIIAGWAIPLDGRLGYAIGVNGGGYSPADLQAWYFRIGTSF